MVYIVEEKKRYLVDEERIEGQNLNCNTHVQGVISLFCSRFCCSEEL